ncbi:MAG TPA: DNA recombination protein RmuC [Rhodospirillaceae bacterium]|nr:DNA recombination protein RmuC [Rhodospirillaceae bacterium]
MLLDANALMYVLAGGAAGLLLGFALGFVLARRGGGDLQNHLAQKTEEMEQQLQQLLQQNARLESDIKNLAEQKALIEQAKQQMAADFKAMSLEALNASRDNFLALAQEKFGQLQTAAQTDIKQVVTPVEATLKQMDEKIALLEKERQGAYGELRQHLAGMKADQEKLRSETSSLVQALRSPSTRGQWGELQLKRTLEMAGMVEGVHYEQQVSVDDQRPDVVIKLPGGKCIVIDSKAPIDAYMDALKDGASEAERRDALDRHARHVGTRIKELGKKSYFEKFESPEFVVMFLPSESYLSAALERDPALLEAGVDQKVIPASPTTLISLLKAVAYGWRQEKLAQNAQEISDLGRDLYKRLGTFGSHMQKIGKGLSGAIGSYNDAVGSLERSVLPGARKFQSLQGIGSDGDLPDINVIEQSPRALTAPELVAPEQDEDTAAGPRKIEKR